MIYYRGNRYPNQRSCRVIALAIAIGVALSTDPTVAQNRLKVRPPTEMVQQLIRDDETVKSLIQDEGSSVVKVTNDIEAETVDLNRDGKPEWVLKSALTFCGASGNCAIWVYRKAGEGYQQLLRGDSIGVDLRKTVTNGYLDVDLTMHSGASEAWISTYKFDGKHYQSKDCVIRYLRDLNGRKLKRPKFRKCEED